MSIDILFIIMASFGFYFGFAFGLIRVVLFVVSLMAAGAAAMRFTPLTAQLISETFEVNSPFLPFVAFIITLLFVMLVARIVTRLLEETIDNTKFNKISQVIGGLMMGLVFTFLFSVLVTFFSKGKVVRESTKEASFFFKYIEKIPETGNAVLKNIAPFIDHFVQYMNKALERLEKQDDLKEINVNTEHVVPDHPTTDDYNDYEEPTDSTRTDTTRRPPRVVVDTVYSDSTGGAD